MFAEQGQWTTQIREIPGIFRTALLSDEHVIHHRPAAGEWSAVEVVGHMIDKVRIWTGRIERLMTEERPAIVAYDQDALVREHDYQRADPGVLFEQLKQGCEHFAGLVEHIPVPALAREGVHEEYGPITIRQCIIAVLESSSEHLEQLRAAQTLAENYRS